MGNVNEINEHLYSDGIIILFSVTNDNVVLFVVWNNFKIVLLMR